MKWRLLFRSVHRDVGYAVAALTVIYAISGAAVNHIEDWNPNYTFHHTQIDLGQLPTGDLKAVEQYIVGRLSLDPRQVKGHFLETATEFRVFLADGQEVKVNLQTGAGVRKEVRTRALLYDFNALHLNSLKGIWTWVADAFALMILLLVVTGVFMNDGKRGILGRGKWFFIAGLLVPIGFILSARFG